jgi:glycosyltransferase involved in cell wall biosynthesis
MPLYNSERTVDEAISSVLNQSYRNLRLIIVDDCSTDRSLEIAKGYLGDPRVTVLSNTENRGAYYCRNAGLAWVADKTWGYFTTHDADDISFVHRYLKLIRILKPKRTVAIQDGWRRIDFYTKQHIRENMTIAHAVFRREVFEKMGYFELRKFGADWEYWKRMEAFSKKMLWRSVGIRAVMGESYVHESNITTLIPQESRPRMLYMKSSRKAIQKRLIENNPYMIFDLEPITKEVGA